MTKTEMVAWVADTMDITNKEAKVFIKSLNNLVTDELINNGVFKFHDLVQLSLKDMPERMGRNPATGESIVIPAKRKVAARVLKSLKDAVL